MYDNVITNTPTSAPRECGIKSWPEVRLPLVSFLSFSGISSKFISSAPVDTTSGDVTELPILLESLYYFIFVAIFHGIVC